MLEDPRFGGLRPPFRAPMAPGDLEPKPDHGERSYVGSSRLKNRTAIVVGGDSGIGRAVAIAFAREGANVLARELAARGVRVNAVEPGPVWAPRMLALTDRQLANFGAGTLLGRPAQPAELAPVYVFLASR
jgi:NAD(P)-dependent dehydrogenase (short-subunit alcohol dehydrogenase family)